MLRRWDLGPLFFAVPMVFEEMDPFGSIGTTLRNTGPRGDAGPGGAHRARRPRRGRREGSRGRRGGGDRRPRRCLGGRSRAELLSDAADAAGLDLVRDVPEIGVGSVDLPAGTSVAELREEIAGEPGVVAVEPNVRLELRAKPSDPAYRAADPNAPEGDTYQWHLRREGFSARLEALRRLARHRRGDRYRRRRHPPRHRAAREGRLRQGRHPSARRRRDRRERPRHPRLRARLRAVGRPLRGRLRRATAATS